MNLISLQYTGIVIHCYYPLDFLTYQFILPLDFLYFSKCSNVWKFNISQLQKCHLINFVPETLVRHLNYDDFHFWVERTYVPFT